VLARSGTAPGDVARFIAAPGVNILSTVPTAHADPIDLGNNRSNYAV
jgi:hypothetical protein